MRLVWPTLPLLAGLAVVAVGVYGEQREPTWLLALISAAAILMSAVSYHRKLRLRKVAIDGKNLYVWVDSRKERIPLEKIVRVEFNDSLLRSWVGKPYRVFIVVAHGPSVVQKFEFVPGYYVKDVVREIRDAVDRAKAQVPK